MQIRIVDYALVAADYHEVRRLQDTSHPTSRSQHFNTAHHTRFDILPVVPESPSFTHAQPPWTAYGYVLWQPLIAQSQNMSDSHVVQIPGFLHEDLMRCHAAWVATNRFPPELINETVMAWQSTKRGKDLVEILDGERNWFVRLDQMSPKDSPFGGNGPSSTFEDVVVKLCSSMRAWNCLQNERADAEAQRRDLRMEMVLNLWDDDMDAGREFRVFVPPPAARGAQVEVGQLKVSAISQYTWAFPFTYPFGLGLRQTASLVCAGANALLSDIRLFVQGSMSEQVRRLLLKYGFSFDVALRHDGTVQLVEVNPFGALSGCGACLFNWVKDGKILYGLQTEVQFAITDKAGRGEEYTLV
ncbi:hypothetical protein SVAN01_10914 [Stagonosporopsis vannaccii]|nr:hypothetical protein SVAN01_10914 [Stagonosporopsis vannaccii]